LFQPLGGRLGSPIPTPWKKPMAEDFDQNQENGNTPSIQITEVDNNRPVNLSYDLRNDRLYKGDDQRNVSTGKTTRGQILYEDDSNYSSRLPTPAIKPSPIVEKVLGRSRIIDIERSTVPKKYSLLKPIQRKPPSPDL